MCTHPMREFVLVCQWTKCIVCEKNNDCRTWKKEEKLVSWLQRWSRPGQTRTAQETSQTNMNELEGKFRQHPLCHKSVVVEVNITFLQTWCVNGRSCVRVEILEVQLFQPGCFKNKLQAWYKLPTIGPTLTTRVGFLIFELLFFSITCSFSSFLSTKSLTSRWPQKAVVLTLCLCSRKCVNAWWSPVVLFALRRWCRNKVFEQNV